MRVPQYIKDMITQRRKAQARANVLQEKIETYFEKHGIEVEWTGTHVALYTEEVATERMYLDAIEGAEKEE